MSLVAAIAATPFVLMYAAAMAPQWITDHRLASLENRALKHPLPPGTTFGGSEPQGPVTGDSGDCWAGFAFSLRTERPPEEIKRYYEAAPFMRTDAHFFELSVSALQESADHVSVAVDTISSGTGDLRCW
ncbi:hypothetical protein LDL08_35880 [Nonomuraea glycinis]|uniref:hypothetical protein n=1 Tax=Nonomuraea glycinis TaxID=2047744 RepID=UPI001668E6B4|nr:hypothetical protein [Nonomuraea glycinis]MCA2181554.1 hypothetical protein [Nonomuraea glycinis]